MTAYNFGDIVLVPFPFTDGSGLKKRPAIVVSAVECQQYRPDIIVMAITSQVNTPSAISRSANFASKLKKAFGIVWLHFLILLFWLYKMHFKN